MVPYGSIGRHSTTSCLEKLIASPRKAPGVYIANLAQTTSLIAKATHEFVHETKQNKT